jgi:hypothetical protein
MNSSIQPSQSFLPGFAPRPALPSLDRKRTGEDGPACLRCGHAPTIVSTGTGMHWKRADCPQCQAWRWLPRPRVGRERGLP